MLRSPFTKKKRLSSQLQARINLILLSGLSSLQPYMGEHLQRQTGRAARPKNNGVGEATIFD